MKGVKNSMNSKGGLESVSEALIGLFLAMMTFYVVMLIWQPVTSTMLFPLLNNAAAFPYGGIAVTLFNVLVVVAVASIFIMFFQEARGKGNSPPPTAYYG